MTQGGEPQLRGRRGSGLLEPLDIGGDMHALDQCDLRHVPGREQVEEFGGGACIGGRVWIPDLRREEFNKR
jgi:hypothetical protein